MLSIKIASARDASVIALIHALSWKSAYRGILSDAYLDNDLEEERKMYWEDKMERLNPGDFVLLACDGDELVGFCAVRDMPASGYEGFIDNLHVLPDKKGQGIGKELMKHAAIRLREAGKNSAYLWVLQGNTAAEKFYLSRGARRGGSELTEFGSDTVTQTRFVWDTLDPLFK